jgi:vancomycin resistance protein VanW
METVRPWVPAPARLWLALSRRAVNDWRSGTRRRFVSPSEPRRAEAASWPAHITVSQSLGRSAHLEAKRHNLATALRALQDVWIEPEALFSFWHLVGEPSRRRGFVPGRNLVDGVLKLSDGGGICQLSGLTYLLALHAGLHVVERHPHSADIYTDATRFSPLGSDATVAYGYKDLRLLNVHPFPIALRFTLGEEALVGAVCAPVPLEPCAVEFSVEDAQAGRRVTTWLQRPGSTAPECLGVSHYRRPSEAA